MNTTLMNLTLPVQLKELKLPGFERHHQTLAEQAQRDASSYSQYLSHLCERELAERYRRRVQRWTREAGLPLGKCFATFEHQLLTEKAAQSIGRLRADIGWAQRAENLLIFGPSGTGKTHLAVALAHLLIEQSIRCKLISAVQLVQQLQQAKAALALFKEMTRYDKYQVVIIDDIGYLKKDGAETQVLFEFIAHRYEGASLVITANHPFSQWDQIFPDGMMTVAAIDRLIHHSTIVEMAGASYRKNAYEKNQASLPKA